MKFLTLLGYILRSLILRGPVATIRMAVKESSGDRHFAIQTKGLQLEHQAGYHHYQGASYLVLEKIFAVLAGFPVPDRFVDVGSGLGRVIFFAEARGFKWLRGVEMNGTLVDKANDNSVRYKKRNAAADLQFYSANALKFDYPSEAAVYFFFNPFDAEIMDACLDRISAGSTADSWFVYMNPLYRSTFENKGFNQVAEVRTNFYTEAIIYKGRSTQALHSVL